MEGGTTHFNTLNLLLKAPSKDAVVNLCNSAFFYRDNRKIPVAIVEITATTFGVEKSEAEELLISLAKFLKAAMFLSSSEPQEILDLFPGTFHKNLRDLLTKIVLQNQSSWRLLLLNSQVTLPQLIDFGWRVQVKSASDSAMQMSAPSCVLELQVSGDGSSPTVASTDCTDVGIGNLQHVSVELSKETLDTMLDGLGKIRDQLSSVASRT